jgi:cysteine synthase
MEIWNDSDGRVTTFVAGLGTSGTLMGVSKRLREYNRNIRIVAVQPLPDQPIQGLKNLEVSYVPGIYDPSRIDETVYVSEADAFETSRLLALNEGIFCGPSSGAAMFAALNKAQQMDEGLVVTLLPDGGEKYMSTPLLDPVKCLECIVKSRRPSCLSMEDAQAVKEMCKFPV